ncbi:hypothetical protein C9374_009803 [Naegleria lovaniensis]|uniref:Partial AB-hydrolase lipase domain-containing protein n=1 Tax=Naegleria lovaniensis TaxID=51637 RepID=A0AA88H3J6_NAELO|nr:uncharacterized protein C9374_009803 [Naegleria lovaniensis]KAG2393226.1 hypothetical protein C9374_009803 [Naegleria lovaniensis]
MHHVDRIMNSKTQQEHPNHGEPLLTSTNVNDDYHSETSSMSSMKQPQEISDLVLLDDSRFALAVNNAVKQGQVEWLDNILNRKRLLIEKSSVNNMSSSNNSSNKNAMNYKETNTTLSGAFEILLDTILIGKKTSYLNLGKCSILQIAVRRADLPMINYLVYKNPYISDSTIRKLLLMKASRNGDNILHVACQTGNHEVVQTVLSILRDDFHILKDVTKPKSRPASPQHGEKSPPLHHYDGQNMANDSNNSNNPARRSISSEYLAYYYSKVADWTDNIKKAVVSQSPDKSSFLSLFSSKDSSHKNSDSMSMIGINDVNDEKYNALFCAILSKSPLETIQTLFDMGCDLYNITAMHENVVHVAAKSGVEEILKHILLLVDEKKLKTLLLEGDKIGRTPFHICAQSGNLEVCKILIEEYRSLEILDQVLKAKDSYGRVAYQVAIEELGDSIQTKNNNSMAKLIHQHMPTALLLEVDERIKYYEIEKNSMEQISKTLQDMPLSSSLATMEHERSNLGEWEVISQVATASSSDQSPPSKSSLVFTVNENIMSAPHKFKEQNELHYHKKSSKVKLTYHDEEQESIFDFVREQGFPIEKHETVTSDGYVLQIHRVPHGDLDSLKYFPDEILLDDELERRKNQKRPVVFIQHGVLNSSSAWLIGGKKHSLALMLANAGFDVWLGNNRGVQFSRKHITWNSFTDKEFWRFSFSEMAKFDFPAQIKYVLKYTKSEKISYIGHSQGTTQAFVALSLFPELQKKLDLFVALAPVCSLKHQTSKLLSMVTRLNTDILFSTLDVIGIGEIGATQLSRTFLPKLTQSLFNEAWSILTDCNIDHDILPILSRYEPSPTSLQNLIHWGQLIKSETFQSFTFPANSKKEAPKVEQYDLKKITEVPIAIFYGTQDYLANPKDVEGFLMEHLQYSLVYHKKIEGFKHNDFVWGREARNEVYNFILHLLIQKTAAFKDVSSPPKTQLTIEEQEQVEKCLQMTPRSANAAMFFPCVEGSSSNHNVNGENSDRTLVPVISHNNQEPLNHTFHEQVEEEEKKTTGNEQVNTSTEHSDSVYYSTSTNIHVTRSFEDIV